MKRILLFFSILCFIACKKDQEKISNNQLEATVLFPNGDKVILNGKGDEVKMGLGFGYTFLSYKNTANQNIALLFYNMDTVGTFELFDCNFHTNYGSPGNRDYSNYYSLSDYSGSVTFTTAKDGYAEGHFDSKCVSIYDTALVNGTFKGNFY